jgi:hypothetical protein
VSASLSDDWREAGVEVAQEEKDRKRDDENTRDTEIQRAGGESGEVKGHEQEQEQVEQQQQNKEEEDKDHDDDDDDDDELEVRTTTTMKIRKSGEKDHGNREAREDEEATYELNRAIAMVEKVTNGLQSRPSPLLHINLPSLLRRSPLLSGPSPFWRD